jgi:hypothetical protein
MSQIRGPKCARIYAEYLSQFIEKGELNLEDVQNM